MTELPSLFKCSTIYRYVAFCHRESYESIFLKGTAYTLKEVLLTDISKLTVTVDITYHLGQESENLKLLADKHTPTHTTPTLRFVPLC